MSAPSGCAPHDAISVMTIDEAATPPNRRDPPSPLKVSVPAELVPARTLKVVADVVPDVMTCTSLRLVMKGVDDTFATSWLTAASALAVLSWNRAIAMVSMAFEQKLPTTSILSLLVALLGVIAQLMNCVPSVLW